MALTLMGTVMVMDMEMDTAMDMGTKLTPYVIVVSPEGLRDGAYGIGQHTHDLANGLQEVGALGALVLPHHIGDWSGPSTVIPDPGFGPSDFTASLLQLNLVLQPHLTALLASLSAEQRNRTVVHFQTAYLAWTVRWLARTWGIPAVVTLHTQERKRQGLLSRDAVYWERMEVLALQDAQRVIAVSAYLQNALAAQYPPAACKLTTVYPILGRAPRSKRITLDGDPPHVAFVGRFASEKGPVDALRAFARAREALSRGTLHMAGAGPMEHRVQDVLKELGVVDSVRLLGYLSVEAAHQLIASADCLLVPSLYESFSMVAAFASEVATPVAGYKVGGIPEALSSHPRVRLVPAGNWEPLGDAIVELCSQGPSSAKSLVIRPSMVDATIAVYQEVTREYATHTLA